MEVKAEVVTLSDGFGLATKTTGKVHYECLDPMEQFRNLARFKLFPEEHPNLKI